MCFVAGLVLKFKTQNKNVRFGIEFLGSKQCCHEKQSLSYRVNVIQH